MKTLTEEQQTAINQAIEKEAQAKGKKVLSEIATRNETFTIVSFSEKETKISEKSVKWIAFDYANATIGANTILNASMMLFRKNIYSDSECKQPIQITNMGLLGTLAAKEAYENGWEIKPKIVDCWIKEYSKDVQTIVESKELTFEIIVPKAK